MSSGNWVVDPIYWNRNFLWIIKWHERQTYFFPFLSLFGPINFIPYLISSAARSTATSSEGFLITHVMGIFFGLAAGYIVSKEYLYYYIFCSIFFRCFCECFCVCFFSVEAQFRCFFRAVLCFLVLLIFVLMKNLINGRIKLRKIDG